MMVVIAFFLALLGGPNVSFDGMTGGPTTLVGGPTPAYDGMTGGPTGALTNPGPGVPAAGGTSVTVRGSIVTERPGTTEMATDGMSGNPATVTGFH
jgi:hypothetical protein